VSAIGTGAISVETAADASLPERIELGDRGHQLRLRWPDGLETALGATALRDACRCAACLHLRRSGSLAQWDADITLEQVMPFGIAGLQLVFSDGHRRGIFPWKYLRELAVTAG
jgi:DUF971 family protein